MTRQIQETGEGSLAAQAGRDVNLGMTQDQLRAVLTEMIPLMRGENPITARGIDTENVIDLIPSDAIGDASLALSSNDAESTLLLNKWHSDYKNNDALLLDIGRIIYLYDKRLGILFTEDHLVFLVRSSLKNDFPVWFWSFFYREKYSHVLPLFKAAFNTTDVKIRLGVIRSYGRFSDSSQDLVELAEAEKDTTVLGLIVTILSKNGEEMAAQRVICNALSRRLVPILDYKEVQNLKTEVGTIERNFLRDVVENGWPNQKIYALNILSLTALESDLLLLESLLESEYETMCSTLHCIERIGKINNQAILIKLLDDTRSEEVFVQILKTLVAVNNRSVLPQLFNWMKDSSSFVWRFSSEMHSWRLNDKIEDALIALTDKEFYEHIVADILSVPDGKHQHLFVWRQFHILGSLKNPDLISLLNNDERLKKFADWEKATKRIATQEIVGSSDKDQLIALITPDNFTVSMLACRQLWKIVTHEEGVLFVNKIDELRKELEKRLISFVDNEDEVVKNLAIKELDYFLGENAIFSRIVIKKIDKKDDKDDESFSILLEDIGKFDRIEFEYLTFILKEEDSTSKEFLLSKIGRPFSVIYETISLDRSDLVCQEINDALALTRDRAVNPLIKILAINALRKLGTINDTSAREDIFKLFIPAREALKKQGSKISKDSAFENRMIYYSAINALADIGNEDDLFFIEESIERETIIHRIFHRYASFYSINSIKRLLTVAETTSNHEEKDDALSSIDTLDFKWSKKLLNIQS